jgi:glutamate dehydrogenase
MKQMPQDLRKQTLDLINANQGAADGSPVASLIGAWLGSLDDEDLAGTSPDSLAPVLRDGFTQAAKRTVAGCQIAQLRYSDGRGGMATALLILNDDMP